MANMDRRSSFPRIKTENARSITPKKLRDPQKTPTKLSTKALQSSNKSFHPVLKAEQNSGDSRFHTPKSTDSSLKSSYEDNIQKLQAKRTPMIPALGLCTYTLLSPYHGDLISKNSSMIAWKQILTNHKKLVSVLKVIPKAIRSGKISSEVIEKTRELYNKCNPVIMTDGAEHLYNLIGIGLKMVPDVAETPRFFEQVKPVNKHKMLMDFYRSEGKTFKEKIAFDPLAQGVYKHKEHKANFDGDKIKALLERLQTQCEATYEFKNKPLRKYSLRACTDREEYTENEPMKSQRRKSAILLKSKHTK